VLPEAEQSMDQAWWYEIKGIAAPGARAGRFDAVAHDPAESVAL